MTRHIALLRAVNVGGTGKLKMAALKAAAEAIGLSDVRTLLQSGNLVFEADKAEGLDGRIETALKDRFGLSTTVIVRSASQWSAIVSANPFTEEAGRDPSHLLVMPLKTAANPGGEAALQAAVKGREQTRVIDACAYLVYPDGIGDSKLTAAVIERALGAVGAARNWNTASKLLAMAQG